MQNILDTLAAELPEVPAETLYSLKLETIKAINAELKRRQLPLEPKTHITRKTKQPAGETGYQGVSFDTTNRKYRARVWDKTKQKRISLGYYETAELASLAILDYELTH